MVLRATELSGVAFSYVRFSAKEQERGDSVRRQVAMRDAWLARHPKVKLDDSLKLHDLGVSAFRGKHRSTDAFALGQFVKLVDSGRVPKGSFLLVENLDRLTREDELTATHLFTGLILAGVRIVQLEPEAIFDRTADQLQIMRLVLEVGRAHAESARKSVRVAEAWSNRKAQAKAEPITKQCPNWLHVVGRVKVGTGNKVTGGHFEFRPGAKGLVQRIFAMCRAGHGCRAIAAAFTREGVKPWGKGIWEEAYIRKILDSRAALGEHQPMKLAKAEAGTRPKRVPDGPPVPDYYPACITEKEWYEAQAARKLRGGRGGRPPANPAAVNPFTGILFDALTGSTLTVNGRTDRGRYYRVLVNQGYKRHGDTCVSFPLETFEAAIFKRVQEIDTREISAEDDSPDTTELELSGRLDDTTDRIARMKAKLTGDEEANVESTIDALRILEGKQRDYADKLAAIRLAKAKPLVEYWKDAQGIIGALAKAKDEREARTRLKAAFSRIVDSIQCVFVHRGTVQLAAVQMWFKPGLQRGFVIVHKHARAQSDGPRTPAKWDTISGPWENEPIDFRNRETAKLIASGLAELDLTELAAACALTGGKEDAETSLPDESHRPKRRRSARSRRTGQG